MIYMSLINVTRLAIDDIECAPHSYRPGATTYTRRLLIQTAQGDNIEISLRANEDHASAIAVAGLDNPAPPPKPTQ